MKHENIILIGMPGAGKSTVGVVLAKVCGYQFVDTDLLIQQKTQKRLWETIEEEGIETFIKLEDQINCELSVSHSIISPGGSVIYCENAMNHFKEIGTVVYLEVDYETIKQRVGNFEHRGIVCRNGHSLEKLYKERIPLYQKYADITIREEGDGIASTVADIVKAL